MALASSLMRSADYRSIGRFEEEDSATSILIDLDKPQKCLRLTG